MVRSGIIRLIFPIRRSSRAKWHVAAELHTGEQYSKIGSKNEKKHLVETDTLLKTFEEHLRNVASTLSRQVGLLRKSSKVFNSLSVTTRCFFSFLLPIFEYCSPVWCSAAECHLALLERLIRQIKVLLPDLNIDIEHRRRVASLCMFYKIYNNDRHPVKSLLPDPYIPSRFTRYNSDINGKALQPPCFNSFQFKRSFIPSSIRFWNKLPDSLVSEPLLQKFKVGVHRRLLNSPSVV